MRLSLPVALAFNLFSVFFAPPVMARTWTQWMWEDVTKIKCAPASLDEVKKLENCKLHAESSTEELDKVSEHIVFEDLIHSEKDNLQCSKTRVEKLMQPGAEQAKALENTCKHLALLKNTIENEDFLRDQIRSYKIINDPFTRPISENEAKRNVETIHNLSARLALYNQIEETLRVSDLLLSSPTVYEHVEAYFKSGLFGQRTMPDVVCQKLTQKATTWLKQDVHTLDAAITLHDKHLSANDWSDDEFYKRQLWASDAKSKLVANFGRDPDLLRGTQCRMESRYGAGANLRDHLFTLGSLALGGGAATLGKVAAYAVFFRRAEVAALSARAALGLDIAVQGYLSAKQVANSCKDNLSVASLASCTPAYQTLEGGNCLLDATLALVSSGLSAYGLKSVLSSNKRLADQVAKADLDTRHEIAAAKSSLSLDSAYEPAELEEAEKVLNRKLSPAEAERIEKAHQYGSDQLGTDGNPARRGTYTNTQLKEKLRLLQEDKLFTPEEAKKLARAGVVGGSGPTLSGQVEVDLTSFDVKGNIGRINDVATSGVGLTEVENKSFLKVLEALQTECKSSAVTETCLKLTTRAREYLNQISKSYEDMHTRLLERANAEPAKTDLANNLFYCALNIFRPECAEKFTLAASEFPTRGALTSVITKEKQFSEKLSEREIDSWGWLNKGNRQTLKNQLDDSMNGALDRESKKIVKDLDGSFNYEECTRVNMNQFMTEMGYSSQSSKLKASREGSKLVLTDMARNLTIKIDPATKYFTVRRPDLNGNLEYVRLKIDGSGKISEVFGPKNDRTWVSETHFSFTP